MKMFTRSLALLTLAAVTVPAFAADTATTFSQKPFTDVPENSAYYQAIEYLRQNNVLKGYEDGTFKPNTRINRAEFVKLITNPYIMNTDRLNQCLQKYDGSTGDNVFFNDVPKDSWYAAEVCYSKQSGVISGYPDGTFKPENNINLAESAKIIAGVFSLQVATQQTPWYKPYVDKLAGLHALPTSLTRLNAPITRGQMAEMIYRLKADVTTKASKSSSQLY